MSGTLAGGKKAAKTNKTKYGADFYRQIGYKGGRAGQTGGFYDRRPWWKKVVHRKNPIAQQAGAEGGRISKRRKNEQDNS